jgi:hypothetical protein
MLLAVKRERIEKLSLIVLPVIRIKKLSVRENGKEGKRGLERKPIGAMFMLLITK